MSIFPDVPRTLSHYYNVATIKDSNIRTNNECGRTVDFYTSEVMGSRLDGMFTIYTYSTIIMQYFSKLIAFQGCSGSNVMMQ